MSNWFSGLNNAEARGGSARLRPGLYPGFRIGEIKVRQGHYGTRFIVAGTVVAEPSPRDGHDPTPLGAHGTWTVQIDGKWAAIGLGETKSFLLACGVTGDLESQMAGVLGGSLVGVVVSTEAWEETTKSGQRLVKHSWAPAEPAVVAAAGSVADAAEGDAPAPAAAPPPPPPAPPAASAPEPFEARAARAGWLPHPDAPGYFYQGTDVKSAADLRALV